MAAASDITIVDADQIAEVAFDEAENSLNTELVRAAKIIRLWDFIPSIDGEYNQTVKNIDTKSTKMGGTALVKLYLTLATASDTCLTSSIRAKIAKYLSVYADQRTTVFPSDGELNQLTTAYNERAAEIRTVLESDLEARQQLAAGAAQAAQANAALQQTTLPVASEQQQADLLAASQQQQNGTPAEQRQRSNTPQNGVTDPNLLAVPLTATTSTVRVNSRRNTNQERDRQRNVLNRTLDLSDNLRDSNHSPIPVDVVTSAQEAVRQKIEKDTDLLQMLSTYTVVERQRLTQLMQSYTSQLTYAHDTESAATAEEEIQEIVNNIDYPELQPVIRVDGSALNPRESRRSDLTQTNRRSDVSQRLQNAASVRRNNIRTAATVPIDEDPRPTHDGLPLAIAQDPELREEVDQLKLQMASNMNYIANFATEQARTALAGTRSGPNRLSIDFPAMVPTGVKASPAAPVSATPTVMTHQTKDAAIRRQINKNMHENYLSQPLLPSYGLPTLEHTLNVTGAQVHGDATVTFPPKEDA